MEKVIKPLFFDWKKIVKQCGGSTLKIMQLLEQMRQKKDLRVKYTGNSFLANPDPLFDDVTIGLVDKAYYVGLASLRNYFDYKYLNDPTLYVPLYSLPTDKIRSNRLLRLDKDNLRFKYEENNYGNQIW